MLFLTISRICQLFSGKEKKDHIIYQISEHDIMDHKGFFIYIKSQEILKFIKKNSEVKRLSVNCNCCHIWHSVQNQI